MPKSKHQLETEQFNKKRDLVIEELNLLQKKYGEKLFKSACNRKITVDQQKNKLEKEIKQKEEELIQLKKGIPLSQY